MPPNTTQRIKLFLGEEVYLEFRPFQEIVLTDGGRVKEAGVPEHILHLGIGN